MNILNTWVEGFRLFRHDLAHRLHWNAGRVVSCTDEKGVIWIGFRCTGCGLVMNRDPAHRERYLGEAVPPASDFT